jgi:hypothetical protein
MLFTRASICLAPRAPSVRVVSSLPISMRLGLVVLDDDQPRSAGSGDLLEHRQQITDARTFSSCSKT